jgi:hypothetical protein
LTGKGLLVDEFKAVIVIMVLLFGLGFLIKYRQAYQLISGYNTLPEEVKQQVDAKALGDFFGRQLMIMSLMPFLGYVLKKNQLTWGTEIGFGVMLLILIYTIIKVKSFIPPQAFNKSYRIGILVSVIITTAVVAVIIWTVMPAGFDLEKEQIVIKGAYGVTIEYSEITSLELEEEFPEFTARTNGASLGPYSKGHFKLADGSRALAFLRSSQGPVIIIERIKGQEPVIINLKNPADTKSLYEQLEAQVD